MENVQEGEIISASPKPQPQSSQAKTFTFPEAIAAVIDGKRITKLEWNDNSIYGFLGTDGYLKINLPEKLSDWTLRDADMKGLDWIILEASN